MIESELVGESLFAEDKELEEWNEEDRIVFEE